MGQTHQSIEILVPADIVWNRIRNFYDMSWVPSLSGLPAGRKTRNLCVNSARISTSRYSTT